MSTEIKQPRFIIKDRDYDDVIVDQEHKLNFLFLAAGGMGVPRGNLILAQRVVDFLNSLPPEETLLYPYNIK